MSRHFLPAKEKDEQFRAIHAQEARRGRVEPSAEYTAVNPGGSRNRQRGLVAYPG